MKRFLFVLCLATTISSLAPAVSQSSGSLISYQGRLTDATGKTVADGMYTVTFNIYEDNVSKFTQTLPVQTVAGVFTAFLGGAVALPTFDPAKSYEIGLTLGGSELTPRQKITSVPMAGVASSLKPGVDITAGNGVFSGNGTFSGEVTVAGQLKVPGVAIGAGFNKPRIAVGLVTLQPDGGNSFGYLGLPTPAVSTDRVFPTVTFLGDDYRGFTMEASVPDLSTVKLRVRGTTSGYVYVMAVYDAQ